MARITLASHVKLLACDWANTVTARASAEGITAFAHAPFGHRPQAADDAAGPGFNGEHQERHGTYLLGHGYRAYLTTLGRFNAPDSYSPFWGGGVNCYTYCRGEPVNRRDPSGHADDNTLNYILIGLGLLVAGGGATLMISRPAYTALGAGMVVGGLLAATTAAMGVGVGAFDEGLQNGLNIAAISLLIGGPAVGGGLMLMGGRRSIPGVSSVQKLSGKRLWNARKNAGYRRPNINPLGNPATNTPLSFANGSNRSPLSNSSDPNWFLVDKWPFDHLTPPGIIPRVRGLGAKKTVNRAPYKDGDELGLDDMLKRLKELRA